jgi:hypothetical protein
LISRLAPASVARWPHNWIAAGLVAIFVVALPLLLNHLHRQERARMVAGDVAWHGSLAHTPALAVLSELLETGAQHAPDDCSSRRCRLPLYHRLVDAQLLAKSPPFDAPPDPAMPVTRYRVEQQAICPPVPNSHGHFQEMTLEELALAAMGQCLVAESAALGDADVVVLDQLVPQSWAAHQTVHDAAYGERLSIYRRDGGGWSKLFQQSDIGGYDWFVPLLVGPLDRGSFLLSDSVGFAIGNTVKVRYFNLTNELASWGLSTDGAIVAKDDMTPLARRLLADAAIPHASAAMQFLAAYPWLGGWRTGDIDTIAAIIRDRRVTEFPPAPRMRNKTPAGLARPIVDRILAADLSAPADRSDVRGERHAVDILTQIFAELQPCAAAPVHDDLQRLADDKARRPYVTLMLRRLADADPGCDPNAKPR